MPTIQPLGTKLLVTPYRRSSQWGGKIQLLEQQRDVLMGDDHIFWVVAVGTKVKDIQPRDRVICKFDHDGPEYFNDGTKRASIDVSQVLAVMPFQEFTETPPAG